MVVMAIAGRPLTGRIRSSLFNKVRVVRKIEHMHSVLTRLGLMQDQAGAVMLNDLPQAGTDRGEDLIQV